MSCFLEEDKEEMCEMVLAMKIKIIFFSWPKHQ